MSATASAKGGGLFESDPNPPPPRPPKVFEPAFLQIEILGESVGAEGAEKFFFGLLTGYFVLPSVSILKILRIWWRIHKWVKNTQKILTPDLTSGRTLADGSLS